MLFSTGDETAPAELSPSRRVESATPTGRDELARPFLKKNATVTLRAGDFEAQCKVLHVKWIEQKERPLGAKTHRQRQSAERNTHERFVEREARRQRQRGAHAQEQDVEMKLPPGLNVTGGPLAAAQEEEQAAAGGAPAEAPAEAAEEAEEEEREAPAEAATEERMDEVEAPAYRHCAIACETCGSENCWGCEDDGPSELEEVKAELQVACQAFEASERVIKVEKKRADDAEAQLAARAEPEPELGVNALEQTEEPEEQTEMEVGTEPNGKRKTGFGEQEGGEAGQEEPEERKEKRARKVLEPPASEAGR